LTLAAFGAGDLPQCLLEMFKNYCSIAQLFSLKNKRKEKKKRERMSDKKKRD